MAIRSFIAVDPSPAVCCSLQKFIEQIKPILPGVHWVKNGFHLTLQFLGEVEEETLEEIQKRLFFIAEKSAPFSLSSSGLGFFPSDRNPRVIWTGLEGDISSLQTLQSTLCSVTKSLLVRQEKDRIFKPHLTIARIRDSSKVSGIHKIQEMCKAAEFGSFEVSELILYRSQLTPSGSQYTKLQEFTLKGK